MDLLFEHRIKLRVRYGETDQMGYCYYGNYAEYFEVGRVEALRSVGMSYREMEESGIMLPVSEFKVNYKSPARYDDELEITTRITRVKGVRIYFDYIIINKQGAEVATASTTLVFVQKEKMNPIPAPESFLEKIRPYQIKEKS